MQRLSSAREALAEKIREARSENEVRMAGEYRAYFEILWIWKHEDLEIWVSFFSVELLEPCSMYKICKDSKESGPMC